MSITDEELSSSILKHAAFRDEMECASAKVFGAPGYELPSATNLVEVLVTEESRSYLQAHGITLQGAIGVGNKILLDPASTKHKIVVFFNNWSGNILVVPTESYVHAEALYEGRDHLVVFSPSQRLSTLRIIMRSDRCALFYGRDCSAGRVEFFIEGPEKCIICGADCMFSAGIPIRTSDGHAVFDITTKEIVNERKSVLIEPHVWIGENVIVLKGARIGRGSIVGARSIVSGHINEFTSAIGVPARELRSGVSWTRQGRPSLDNINEAIRNCNWAEEM